MEPEPRSRRLVAVFIGVQLALPTLALLIRWSGGDDTFRWAWHMFSTI